MIKKILLLLAYLNFSQNIIFSNNETDKDVKQVYLQFFQKSRYYFYDMKRMCILESSNMCCQSRINYSVPRRPNVGPVLMVKAKQSFSPFQML